MHEEDRTLGDVPGLNGLLPDGAVLPTGYSVTEVNALGDTTADPSMLADVLDGVGMNGDPFAVGVGFLDNGGDGTSAGGSNGGGTYVQHDPMASSYMPTLEDNGTSGGVVSQGFDEEQMSNARTIAAVGKKLGASDRDIQIALMTAIVESGLRNLDYGDRDSLGLFQQRDAWGSAQDRTNPAKAAQMFFEGGAAGQRGLFDFKDRDKMSLGEAAQAVQVSAYPDRYAQHEGEAAQLMGSLGENPSSGDTTGRVTDSSYIGPYKPSELLKRAETLANAGGKDPYFNSVQDGSWYRDCQHMVANLSGRSNSGYSTASAAWNHFESTGAAHADGSEPPVGAWLYYSGSSSAGHVAVYLGNGKVASTDVFGNGRVGIGDMKELTDGAWHLNYLGWAAPWGEGTPKALKVPAQQKQSAPTWRDQVVRTAKTYLGTPFKWGGSDYTGVDTEGFLHGIYSKVGLKTPMTGDDIATLTQPIAVEQAKPGDIIGWANHPETGGYHYGIYLGDGQMIEAGVPGRVVQVSSLGEQALSGAFGIPVQKLIHNPPKDPFSPPRAVPEVNHASVPSTAYNTYMQNNYTNPGTAEHVKNPATGHSMVEPHAAIPSHTNDGPDKHGGQQAGLGALNPNHPHAPMPGQPT